MSYRDDLDAAQARADAAERRAAALQKQLDAKTAGAPAAPEVPIPERFKLTRSGDELVVSWRWFKPGQHLFMLFFVIAWDAFLVAWYAGGIASGKAGVMMFVFPIAHVAVGVGLTYAALTGIFNRTHVKAGFGRLRIEHGPLPWPGATLSRAEIKQLYVAEGVIVNDKPTWNLCALLESNQQRKLVRGLEEKGQGRYLEQLLEQHLGVENAPVVGEAAKD